MKRRFTTEPVRLAIREAQGEKGVKNANEVQQQNQTKRDRDIEVPYRRYKQEVPRPGYNYSNDGPVKDNGNQEYYYHSNLQTGKEELVMCICCLTIANNQSAWLQPVELSCPNLYSSYVLNSDSHYPQLIKYGMVDGGILGW